jgi:hypothetical protein
MKGQKQLFDKISGDMELKNNAVIVKNANGRVNEARFELSGTMKNALPYISRKGQKLDITASFKAKALDLNKIFDTSSSKRDTSYDFSLPGDVSFDLDVAIDKISFRKFEAQDLRGKAYYQKGLLTLNPLFFNTAQGSVKARGSVKQQAENDFYAEASATIKDMELRQFFAAFENFGQAVIQSENLSGRAGATIDFSSRFNEKLNINKETVAADIDLMVLNGELKNVAALQNIAAYLHENALWNTLIKVADFEKELKVVKFDTLKNQIRIKDKTTVIPSMRVGSSAMALNLSGSHTFDNQIDYAINFRLSDLLQTGKQKESDFGYIVDDPSGLKLFMKMTGTTENPEFSLDKDGVRQRRKQQLADEKDEVKGMLKEEFGLFKSDTSITATEPEKETKDPKFSVEWKGFGKDSAGTKPENTTDKGGTDFYDELDEDDDL